jgi:hypothetical protein
MIAPDDLVSMPNRLHSASKTKIKTPSIMITFPFWRTIFILGSWMIDLYSAELLWSLTMNRQCSLEFSWVWTAKTPEDRWRLPFSTDCALQIPVQMYKYFMLSPHDVVSWCDTCRRQIGVASLVQLIFGIVIVPITIVATLDGVHASTHKFVWMYGKPTLLEINCENNRPIFKVAKVVRSIVGWGKANDISNFALYYWHGVSLE